MANPTHQNIHTLHAAIEVRSASAAPETPLPTEFRIFKKGANPWQNGDDLLFDAVGAARSMAAAARWNVDYMIDLQHQSLGLDFSGAGNDALGWFRQEVRDGEMWAANVSWTDAGAARLRARTQRYISPAFRVERDDKTGIARVVELINCGLVSMPALNEAPPLVANRRPSYDTTPSVSTRFTAEQRDYLAALAAAQGTSVSTVVRELVAAGLTQTESDVAAAFAATIKDPERRRRFIAGRYERAAKREVLEASCAELQRKVAARNERARNGR